MTDKQTDGLTMPQAIAYAEVLAMFPGFPLAGSTRFVGKEELHAAHRKNRDEPIVMVPPQDWAVVYACKLCVTTKKEFPGILFRDEASYERHLNSSHGPPREDGKRWFEPSQPSYPSIIAEAQSCAVGCLVAQAGLDDSTPQMLCFFCNIRFTDVYFLKRRLCPFCRRQYFDFYRKGAR